MSFDRSSTPENPPAKPLDARDQFKVEESFRTAEQTLSGARQQPNTIPTSQGAAIPQDASPPRLLPLNDPYSHLQRSLSMRDTVPQSANSIVAVVGDTQPQRQEPTIAIGLPEISVSNAESQVQAKNVDKDDSTVSPITNEIPNNAANEPTAEEIISRKSYQLRALTRKTVSYQKRQVFVNVCCITLCPFFMIALSSIIGALLSNLINSGTPLSYYNYCSNYDAMNSTWNVPLSKNLPNVTRSEVPSIPKAYNVVGMTNFWVPPLTTGGRPLATFPQSCTYWGSKSYPFSSIYERDPFVNMTNQDAADAVNVNTLQGQLARRLYRMDSSFTPDTKYGRLNIQALVADSSLILQLTSIQLFPWANVQEPEGLDLGWNNRTGNLNFNIASMSSLANNQGKSGILGSTADSLYLRLTTSGSVSFPVTPTGPGPAQQTFRFDEAERVPYFPKYPASQLSDSQMDDKLANHIREAVVSLTKVDKDVLYEDNPSIIKKLQYNAELDKIISQIPWGNVLVKSMDSANRRFSITLQVGSDKRISQAASFPSEGFRKFWLSSYFTNAIIKAAKPGFSIVQGIRVMPSIISSKIELPFASFIGRILYPFGVSFLLPIFAIILAQEKEERIMVMMKMNGVRSAYYTVSHFVHFYILHILVALVFIISGLLFQLEFFTKTEPIVYIILFIVWGFAQIAIAFFLSAFFSKSRSALVITFLIVLLNVIINIASENIFSDGAPWIYLLWPPFAFYRSLSIVNRATYATNTRPYTLSRLFSSSDEAFLCLFLMIGVTCILFPLSSYLNNVFPTEYGVQKPWHYPISEPLQRLRGQKMIDEEKEKQHFRAQVNESEAQFEDSDVKVERERVDATEFGPDHPLVIRHMRKIYPGATKVAVKDVTIAIEQNTIFGLLGPNGAGKTSLISILTGLYEPTFGEAKLGGYDIKTQQDSVYKITGICPQHDILWGDLTVQEHLLFYARIKGIPPHEEMQAVEKAIESVSLQNFRTRLSKGLSGGEKRRLSIAIALIGSPKAVFFDEPTTGLDPEVRRVIWNIIQNAKQGRTVILTTHSMEEAEVLCQRIGIMARGTLRCIGPLLRLKQLYGSGFKLVFLTKPENMAYTSSCIKKLLPEDSVVIDVFQSSMTFEFNPKPGQLAYIFEKLEKNADEWLIEDWGISQTSLEEVFLKLVSEQDAEGTSE